MERDLDKLAETPAAEPSPGEIDEPAHGAGRWAGGTTSGMAAVSTVTAGSSVGSGIFLSERTGNRRTERNGRQLPIPAIHRVGRSPMAFPSTPPTNDPIGIVPHTIKPHRCVHPSLHPKPPDVLRPDKEPQRGDMTSKSSYALTSRLRC